MEVGLLVERVIAYLELQERSIAPGVAKLKSQGADKTVIDCALWEFKEVNALLGQLRTLRDFIDMEHDGEVQTPVSGAKDRH